MNKPSPRSTAKEHVQHAFVATVAQLIEHEMEQRNRVLRLRKLIIHARATSAIGNRTRDFSAYADIADNCLMDNGKVLCAIQARELAAIVRGNCIPTIEQIAAIAADFGLDAARKDAFMNLGNDYLTHCEKSALSGPAAKTPPAERALAPMRESAAPEDDSLQSVLRRQVGSRWFERATGEVYREKPASKHVIPLLVGHLHASYGLTTPQRELLNGKRPDPTRKINIASDKEALEDLLAIIDATLKEEQQAYDAFDKAIAGRKRNFTEMARRADPGSSTSAIG